MILRLCDLMVEYARNKLSKTDLMNTTTFMKIAHPLENKNDLQISIHSKKKGHWSVPGIYLQQTYITNL